MKAPAAKRAKPAAKAKAKPAKRYTAAQNASFNAWKKTHPFKNAARKAATTSTAKRTLSLNDPHVISQEDSVQLGRNRPYTEAEKPRLILDGYLAPSTAAPSVVDFASEIVSWPMYSNDTIGDCTAACAGHEIQAWTRYTGAEVDVPEDEIIQLYSAVSGYDPATGANDNGAAIQDVLAYWRQSGIPVAGHKILAFAQLKDLSRVKDALWMFGSVYLGINCPQSALDQFNAGQPWTVGGDGTIAGGHAIPLQWADSSGHYGVVTWARLQGMDQGFLDTYCEEAWVVITADWLDKNGHTPDGLDLQQLGQDLADLTGEPSPFPAPPPAPVPPAPVPAPPAPVPPAPPVPIPPPPPAPQPVDPSVIQDFIDAVRNFIRDVENIL